MRLSSQASRASCSRNGRAPCARVALGGNGWLGGLRLFTAALTMVLAVTIVVGCGSEGTPTDTKSSGAAGKTTTVGGIQIASDPALTEALPDSLKASGVLRVAMNIPYPPWEMYVSEGSKEVTGLDWDLSGALAAKLGLEAKALQLPFPGLIPAVQANKADVVISALYDSKEREQALDFVDYAYDGGTIVVEKGNPEGITSLDDLAGKRVAVTTSTSQAIMAAKLQKQFKADGKPAMDVVQLPNSSDPLLAIQAGKAVAGLMNLATGGYAAKTYQNGNAFEIVLDPEAPNGYDPGLVGAGVAKSNTELRDVLQQALQALIDEGTYAKLLDKYGLAASAVESATVNKALL